MTKTKRGMMRGASYPSFSEKLGRKLTFIVIFVLGAVLYASIPANAGAGGKLLFVLGLAGMVSCWHSACMGCLPNGLERR
jgi:hypothetical protein